MWRLLAKIPYRLLIVVTLFMLLAPFQPMPHVWEKLLMLKNGTFNRPIDIFDLFYHTFPLVILVLKAVGDWKRARSGGPGPTHGPEL
jgi:hypothetical protein